MALNLIRNSRVFYTTNLTVTGQVAATGFTTSNTKEIQVQDGFSFSQNTGQETVAVNESGAVPVRGQRSFNTSLEPVDWSFSTYIRPKFEEGSTSAPALDADDYIGAEEDVLWNSLSGTAAIGLTGAGWTTSSTFAPPFATCAFGNSNAHQLHASVAWAGKGTTMRQVATAVTLVDAAGTTTMSGGLGGTAKSKDTTAAYIANKLSTMTLAAIAFGGLSAKTYTLALTGGSLTISNNLTYLTPANLGVVNQPITYFTGTRGITATVNAYLKTGTNETSTLLRDMLAASSSSTENKFSTEISLGGAANTTKVVLSIPTAQLTIPAINSEQIIATSINLTAQGATTGAYDLGATNELEVRYFATNTTI